MFREYILTLSCPDQTGLVYRVSEFLFQLGCNIEDAQQFMDSATQRFFMRVQFKLTDDAAYAQMADQFARIARAHAMDWQLTELGRASRLLVLVSRQGHCLSDLLYRAYSQQLPVEIAAVVSNHADLRPLAEAYRVPFHHLPINAATRSASEERLLQIVQDAQIDLVVLARYMQIWSPSLCTTLAGRAINIHHSFLPSFKGAKPYYQAFQRGVKLIGATAHYVTSDLDEGPIIDQDVIRVDHTMSPAILARMGSDIESVVLARAVRSHVERRIFLHGHRTVVFR